MMKKIALCVVVLGSLGIGVTAHATSDTGGIDQKTQDLLEKAEVLSQSSDEDILNIDGYEVSLGETTSKVAEGDLSRNATVLHGNVSVSRAPMGGVMRATANSRTTRTVNRIGAQARVNNNGGSVNSSGWNYLFNTTFVTNSQNGNSRSGIGHGNHNARQTATSNPWGFNTTNTSFQ